MRGRTGKLTDEPSGQPETSDYWFRAYSIPVTTGQTRTLSSFTVAPPASDVRPSTPYLALSGDGKRGRASSVPACC